MGKKSNKYWRNTEKTWTYIIFYRLALRIVNLSNHLPFVKITSFATITGSKNFAKAKQIYFHLYNGKKDISQLFI